MLQLEHVGSSAVPGLAAKPVIDIDLAVDMYALLTQLGVIPAPQPS